MTVTELQERVNSRAWFHRIDLGNGIVTPGVDDSPVKLDGIQMPEDLTGWSVLDIGAFDGFFSFEAERRGASRVLATDKYCWSLGGMGTKDGFDLAHQARQSRVESRLIPVEDLSPASVGTFDLVLFLGVFYHSEDPMRYLRIVRSLCKRQAIIETHIDAMDYPRPAMVFYPGSTLNNDPSNFWGPNVEALTAMVKEVGFSRVEVGSRWRPDRQVVHAFV